MIALGLGIDVYYALHNLSVTITHLRKGSSLSGAYYFALLPTGKMVVMTGITSGIAVLKWLLSSIKFQADMVILLGFMCT